jgi:hypothetical protein
MELYQKLPRGFRLLPLTPSFWFGVSGMRHKNLSNKLPGDTFAVGPKTTVFKTLQRREEEEGANAL